MPTLLRPKVGKLQLTDYERVFCADPANDIFDKRGIDRGQGALILVRPDGYVAHVLPLDGTGEGERFFAGFMCSA